MKDRILPYPLSAGIAQENNGPSPRRALIDENATEANVRKLSFITEFRTAAIGAIKTCSYL